MDQDLTDALNKVDADTNAVAATVKSLDALISTSMTQDDVNTVKQKLADIATRLEQTAADPNVPVPPNPPPPPVNPPASGPHGGGRQQPFRPGQPKPGP